MDTNDLAAMLRERLSLSVRVEHKTEFGPDERIEVSVTLSLDGEEIASDRDSVSLPRRD